MGKLAAFPADLPFRLHENGGSNCSPCVVYKELKSILYSQIIQNRSYADGSTILFHWGYGIGFDYAHNGTILTSRLGNFGELGHIKVNLNATKRCICGATGCLEAESAIWSLLPRLTRAHPSLTADERSFAELMAHHDLLAEPAIRNAVNYIKVALSNLYRHFYPDRLLVIGPFVENERIFDILRERLAAEFPDSFPGRVVYELVRDAHRGCLIGNTYGFFRDRMRQLLRARY